MRNPSLAELQLQFKETIKKNKTDFDAERMHVYQQAYFSRIHQSLREDFKSVYEVLGENKFTDIVEKYIEFYPSRFWTLAEYSADFPKFMDNYVDNHFLHDLAQFEWFKIKCSLGQTALKFDPQILAQATDEDWIGARMRLVPTLKIFSSHWPVNDLSLLKKPKLADRNQIYYYALFRSIAGLNILDLTETEVKILEEMSLGKTFSELAQIFEQRQVSVEQVSVTVAKWVQEGLIDRVLFGDKHVLS